MLGPRNFPGLTEIIGAKEETPWVSDNLQLRQHLLKGTGSLDPKPDIY